MALAQTVTVSTTQEVRLDPALKRKLIAKLKVYAEQAAQLKALKAKVKSLAAELGDLRDETGETSVTIEGVGTITLVAPLYSKFNPNKFVALGGDLAIYQQAVETKPKKSFNKVTLPGARDEEEE